MNVWNFDLPHVYWFKKWQEHLQKAKAAPNANAGYCFAAAIAHMEYECYWALFKREHHVDR